MGPLNPNSVRNKRLSAKYSTNLKSNINFQEPENEDVLDFELDETLQQEPDDVDIDDCDSSSSRIVDSYRNSLIDTPCNVTNDDFNDEEDMLKVFPKNTTSGSQSDYLPQFKDSKTKSCLDSSDSDQETYSGYQSIVNDDGLGITNYQCDLTPEQEDSLLKSDEETTDSPDEYINESQICTPGLFQICVIGDKRMCIDPNLPTNGLKRMNPLFQHHEAKKSKWNVTYTNHRNALQIHLREIGYEALEDDLTNNNADSGSIIKCDSGNDLSQLNKPESETVIITVDRQSNRHCKFNSSASSSSCSVSSGGKIFKMPLPPAKRPPSRPKKTPSETSGDSSVHSGISSNTLITVSSNNERRVFRNYAPSSDHCRTQDDDIISLAASSIGFNDDLLENDDKNNQNKVYPMFNQDCDLRVRQWIDKVSSTNTDVQPNLDQNAVPSVVPEVNNDQKEVKGYPRVLFKDIPSVFRNICYHYYINQRCFKNTCVKSHVLPVNRFMYRAQRLEAEQLLEAYNFMVNNKLTQLYKESHPIFLKCFAVHKMQKELISCINDFYALGVNIFNGIELVIQYLQELNLTFVEAVENIVLRIGLTLPNIGDILLEMLTSKQDRLNKIECWQLIKKIVRALSPISPEVAQKILHCATNSYPLDRKMLMDVYEVIIKNKLTDLSQISESVLLPFKTVEEFSDNTKRVDYSHNSQELQTEQNVPDFDQNVQFELETTRRIYQTEQRTCNFNSGKITTSYSKGTDTDERNGNYVGSCHSSGSRSNSVCSGNQYVPQNILVKRNEFATHTPQVKSEYTLTPILPHIGNVKFSDKYIFNQSLHYLCPEVVRHNVSLDECDHVVLKKALIEIDGLQFLQLVDKYQNKVTLENFIINMVLNIKDHLKESANIVMKLVKSIDIDKLENQTRKLLKVIFEVLVMNLVIELEKCCYFKEAAALLEYFTDWDGLVSSQLFQTFGPKKLTHMGKYIYLAKLLCKGGLFHYVHRILMSTELHLMEHPSRWPYFSCSGSDLEQRNMVVDDFFRDGHRFFLLGVLQLHTFMLTSVDMFGYDRILGRNHLNSLLKTLLEDNQIGNLNYFYNFFPHYYPVLDRSLLRSLASIVSERLSVDERIQLYEMCHKRDIYDLYTGEESTIVIFTDNTDSEILLIFGYYFHKKQENNISHTDLRVELRPAANRRNHVNILNSPVRSILVMNATIKKLLRNNFNVIVRDSQNSSVLEIPAQELINIT